VTVPGAGQFYRWLDEAVPRAGSQRSLDSQDTTLSRRGLLIRADKRARELQGLKIGAGDVVALSMGNVAEFVILLLAVSKLGAIAMPVDPANGDRSLLGVASRLPVRAVLRRPRGLENSPLQYPEGYKLLARRKLSGSLLEVDTLELPEELRTYSFPDATEYICETAGADGALHDVFRTGAHLRWLGESAAKLLDLGPGTHLACAQAFTSPRFFDPVVLGWLASEARLVMADNPTLESVLPPIGTYERLVVVDLLYSLQIAARALKAAGATRELLAVIPQATIATSHGRLLKQVFGEHPRQLLLLEEIGILGVRKMHRGERFEPTPGIELRPGAAHFSPTHEGGHEVLFRPNLPDVAHPVITRPAVPSGQPGGPVQGSPGWFHTGYFGQFTGRSDAAVLGEVPGRTDSLVNLEGRRASLRTIEAAMLRHRRIHEATAEVEYDVDGNPFVHLRYRATGNTTLDDLDEFMVDSLPPYMVPRQATRLDPPPA
jgi:acyl-CoA synthetase (AMP-forming)/AMP-acid ligase II